MSAETENQSSEPQDGQCTAVPSSPVLSQMAMPGTWLLGHRRLPGMLGQMPSVIMGRSQVDQVGVIKPYVVHELKADFLNDSSCIPVDKRIPTQSLVAYYEPVAHFTGSSSARVRFIHIV